MNTAGATTAASDTRPQVQSDPRMPSRVRIAGLLSAGVLWPLCGALLVCALGSVWPVRLDLRSFQDLSRVQSAGVPTTGLRVVFLTRDNEMPNARAANFGLRHLAFPDGSVYWATLREHSQGPWVSGFAAVDGSGVAHSIAGGETGAYEWSPMPEVAATVRERLAGSLLLYDSADTRRRFEERWPFLAEVRQSQVLPDDVLPSYRRSPAAEFTLTRLWRLTTLIGAPVAVCLALLRWLPVAPGLRFLLVAGGVLLGIALPGWAGYLLQWTLPPLVEWRVPLVWGGALVLAAAGARRTGAAGWRLARPTGWLPWTLLTVALTAYVALFAVRLDFDGDVFTNWLPQARFHYLLERHDPAAVVEQESMQAATYPPGFGVLLSNVMWASDLPRRSSFTQEPSASFAILVYRLLIAALNVALLLALAVYLHRLDRGTSRVWVLGLALCLLLIPSTAGRHIAAETYLFPLLGTAIVLIAAGRNFGAPALVVVGGLVGGLATFIKWEASIVLAMGVLPWVFSGIGRRPLRLSRGEWFACGAALVIAAVPTAVWKLALDIDNAFFGPVSWARLEGTLPVLPTLVTRAVRMTLEDGRLLLVGVALPCAVIVRAASLRRVWTQLAVPLGVWAACVFWVVVFLFSNLYPATYLENSYQRLLMVPAFGALLYCLETVTCYPALAGAEAPSE